MVNKKFTLEEMEYLRGNEYVLDVTDSCVYFSAAYKAEFYQKLLAGKKAKDIFAESGINTDILGVNRVNGFRSLVLREAKSGKGFRDIPYGGCGTPTIYGFTEHDGETYMLMEFFEGETMSQSTREKLILALDALIQTQEKFWGNTDLADAGWTFEKQQSPLSTATLAYYTNYACIGSEEYYGNGWLIWWYQRNLNIFTNIMALVEGEDEKRILLLIGAAHKGILERFSQNSRVFEVVDASAYLK